jgi:hypothetical protein
MKIMQPLVSFVIINMRVPFKQHGFTLIETILYIGLFTIIFFGICISIYPFFTNIEHLTRKSTIESETAFILAKIQYILSYTITSSDGIVVTPTEGNTAHELLITHVPENKLFYLGEDISGTFCTPPLACKMLVLGEQNINPLPLNTQRVHVENFTVTHHAPDAYTPRYLDISFEIEHVSVGPIRYYLHF